MDVATQRQDGVLLVEVSGRIDHSNAAAFDSAVSAASDADDVAVLMDLGKLSYINTVGLRTFLKVAERLRGAATKMALCAMSDGVRRVFAITGFDTIFPIYPSRAEALAYLALEQTACARGD